MSEPDPTGTPDDRPKSSPEGSGFALPSWVDAAITRSQDEEPRATEPVEAPVEAVPLSPVPEILPELVSSVAPAPEPMHAATPARKGLALPWLLAAFLFAAAALVLAFLIWFKPAR